MDVVNTDSRIDLLNLTDYEVDIITSSIFYFLKFQKDNDIPLTCMTRVALKMKQDIEDAITQEEKEPDFDAMAKDARIEAESLEDELNKDTESF